MAGKPGHGDPEATMAWSTAQVARLAKVTSRTLRHYDEIGLLPPARVGGNGYRYYEREQLLRLQQILLLRQLGLGLDAIAEILHRGRDQVEALRTHHRWLLAERDRFDRLARTVARTIQDLEGGEKMTKGSVDHWFDGFDEDTEARLTAEAEQRWGTETVRKANEQARGRTARQWQNAIRPFTDTLTALLEFVEADTPVDDPRVQEIVDGHFRWISSIWTPNRESYTGLGELYADDPRFRAQFDRTHPRLAEYLRDAMAAYARARLS